MTRDEKGRFAKGISGNPKGRPPREVEEEYRNILVSTVTKADWQAIIERAVKDAKRGNPQARKFLADYLIGLPVQRVAGDKENPLEIIFRYADSEPKDS